tara:strand:+ start:865 stop:1299 length:435 start_codon:yes stop_codon:yes gene_type:complete
MVVKLFNKYLGVNCIQYLLKNMLRKEVEENYPFLSVVTYGGEEYVGIIVNQDQFVTTMLIYSSLRSVEDKNEFMRLGEIWWNESNRLIPISIFLRKEINSIMYSQMTMNSKDVKVILGPTVNLNNLSFKRVKRKNVQLVRKPKD